MSMGCSCSGVVFVTSLFHSLSNLVWYPLLPQYPLALQFITALASLVLIFQKYYLFKNIIEAENEIQNFLCEPPLWTRNTGLNANAQI